MTRLPRRFDSPMKVLRELANSKNERIRLQAAMRMTDILLSHMEAEQRATVATERAAARRAEAEASAQPNTTPASAEESLDVFLTRIKAERDGQRQSQIKETNAN